MPPSPPMLSAWIVRVPHLCRAIRPPRPLSLDIQLWAHRLSNPQGFRWVFPSNSSLFFFLLVLGYLKGNRSFRGWMSMFDHANNRVCVDPVEKGGGIFFYGPSLPITWGTRPFAYVYLMIIDSLFEWDNPWHDHIGFLLAPLHSHLKSSQPFVAQGNPLVCQIIETNTHRVDYMGWHVDSIANYMLVGITQKPIKFTFFLCVPPHCGVLSSEKRPLKVWERIERKRLPCGWWFG